LRSLLELMDLSLEAPDHKILSPRSKGLNAKLVPIASKNPIHLSSMAPGCPSSEKANGPQLSMEGVERDVCASCTSAMIEGA
jgi:hypothetical protein